MEAGLLSINSMSISEIEKTWQRFVRWLDMRKYGHVNHQWMEENQTLRGNFKLMKLDLFNFLIR